MTGSLQDRCGVAAAVVISNFPKVKDQIFSTSLFYLENRSEYQFWKKSLNSVVSNVLKEFNSVLKQIIPDYLFSFIGLEMLRFGSFLQSEFELQPMFIHDFMNSSIFTSRGMIDEEKAARKLMKDVRLSSLQKYRMACYYFLNDLFPSQWQDFQDSGSNFEEVLRSYDYKDPAVICAQYLKNKGKSQSDAKLKFLTVFLDNFFSSEKKNENLYDCKFYWKSLMLVLRHCETEVNEEVEDFNSLIRNFFKRNKDIFFHVYYPLPLLFLSREIIAYRDVFLLLLHKNREDMVSVLIQFDLIYQLLKSLLFWPLQDLFLKTAESLFPILNILDYYRLLQDILDMITDNELSQTYNYRLLLREFWIKSPDCFNKYAITLEFDGVWPDELARKFTLLSHLCMIIDFTVDDMRNFLLILESATPETRDLVLNNPLLVRVFKSLFMDDNYEAIDLFIDNIINEEKRENFKKKIVHASFLEVVTTYNLDLVKKLVEWAARTDEVDNVKQELIAECVKISDVLTIVHDKPSYEFLDIFLKWMFNSDEKYFEWKMNWNCNELYTYYFIGCRNFSFLNRFVTFLIWLGYSDDKICLVKKNIFHQAFPNIVRILFNEFDNHLFLDLHQNLLFLCSYNKEVANECIYNLRVWCLQKIEENVCIICHHNEDVYYDNERSKFLCRTHANIDIMSTKTIDFFCTKLLEDLHKLSLPNMEKNDLRSQN